MAGNRGFYFIDFSNQHENFLTDIYGKQADSRNLVIQK